MENIHIDKKLAYRTGLFTVPLNNYSTKHRHYSNQCGCCDIIQGRVFFDFLPKKLVDFSQPFIHNYKDK